MSECIHGIVGACPACRAGYDQIRGVACEHYWIDVSVHEVPQTIRERCVKCGWTRLGVPLESLKVEPVGCNASRNKLIDALVVCVDRVGTDTANVAYESWNAPDERILRDEFAKILDQAGRKWTTEKPTVRGFYWFREIGGDELFMVEVYNDGTMWRSHYIEEEKMTEGEWAGPLEPPE